MYNLVFKVICYIDIFRYYLVIVLKHKLKQKSRRQLGQNTFSCRIQDKNEFEKIPPHPHSHTHTFKSVIVLKI